MRTRLTERDLSRIVRRVINEQDEDEGAKTTIYCDIDDISLNYQYEKLQPYIDKLIKSENINYDCESHKILLRHMLIGELCDVWNQQIQPKLSDGVDPRDLYSFLESRYVF